MCNNVVKEKFDKWWHGIIFGNTNSKVITVVVKVLNILLAIPAIKYTPLSIIFIFGYICDLQLNLLLLFMVFHVYYLFSNHKINFHNGN